MLSRYVISKTYTIKNIYFSLHYSCLLLHHVLMMFLFGMMDIPKKQQTKETHFTIKSLEIGRTKKHFVLLY